MHLRTALSAALVVLAVAGCSGTSSSSSSSATTSTATASPMASMSGMDMSSPMPSMSGMDMSTPMESMSAQALPTDIPTATNAKYPVGSRVTILADHMTGMKGAKGTVAAVYATTTYAVDYTPTTGGAVVKDHKWVVQQEIQGAGTTPYKVGDAVVLTASHMAGMKGAKAVIREVVTEPVYAVNYTPTTGGAMMMNHLWVVQDELAAA